MSYNLSPYNEAGSFRARYPSPYDAYGDSRNLFLLDGITPASTQERLHEILQDNQHRKETPYLQQYHMTRPNMQRENVQHWGPLHNEHLDNHNQFSGSQPYMNASETPSNPPVYSSYASRPPIPIGRSTRYIQMPDQSRDREFTPRYQLAGAPLQYEQRPVGDQIWNQNIPTVMKQHHRHEEPQQVDPPLNYFTRFVTISESYSSAPVNEFPHDTIHHHSPREMSSPLQHDTMCPYEPESNIHHNHIPQTMTDMNELLNMPKQTVPYADRFQMPPSKKLLRRQGSLGPEDRVSQTSPDGYKGDPAVGIRNLADRLNCSLWLTNLSPNMEPHEIFENIDAGAVSAFGITRPQGFYIMAAAKLVFKHPEAAARFMQQCESGAIWIRGLKVKSRYNTFGHLRYNNRMKTRVLSVEGPAEFVEYQYLKLYFESFCDHELSSWEVCPSSVPSYRKLVWGFARIDGQAVQCLEGLRAHPVYGKFLTVKYAPDPCGRIHP